jgi:hypothetical protein
MKKFSAVLFSLFLFVPSFVSACACGCGVFDIQTGSMLPTKPGRTAFLEYDYMDQNKNWSRATRSSDDLNGDKRIETHFVTAGLHEMIDRKWGYQVEVPYWNRRFVKASDADGSIGTFDHGAVGDVRVRGVYAGLSDDMSTGLTFGLKLPTGDFENPNFDRDTQIGTGSTDLLLGAYRMGRFAGELPLAWFGTLQYDQPVLTAAGYRPGAELSTAFGSYIEGLSIGSVRFVPLLQGILTRRWSDQGTASNAPNSGYDRAVLAPGVELGFGGGWKVDASVGVPIYQYVVGQQVVSGQFDRFTLSRSF